MVCLFHNDDLNKARCIIEGPFSQIEDSIYPGLSGQRDRHFKYLKWISKLIFSFLGLLCNVLHDGYYGFVNFSNMGDPSRNKFQ